MVPKSTSRHGAFASRTMNRHIRSYSQSDLFITSLQPGSTPKNLTTNYDYDIAGGIGGDQAPPRGGAPSKPFWSKDGRYIFIVAAEEGRANLKRVDDENVAAIFAPER